MPRQAPLLALLIAFGAAAVQAQSRTLRGVIVDSASGQAIAGALVDLRSGTFRATDRSDEEGNFRIRAVPDGQYGVSVLRIGFAESRWSITIAGDTSVTVRMRSAAQRLDAFRVRADVSAIYGMVGTLPDLLPIQGARVQVIGAKKEQVTDSTGGFFMEVKEPGMYMVRMTREGYADRMFNISVPRGRAVDASRMLDPGVGMAKGRDVLFVDLDQRMRMRATGNSAIVAGAELRAAGTNLFDALRASRSFNAPGLRFGLTACVFVDGVPRPNLPLEAYRPEDIESVEVYGVSLRGTGDRSNNLQNSWPRGAGCGTVDRTVGYSSNAIQSGLVKYVVIWLKK